MRYIVKKLNDDEYEVTHIDTREDLEGKEVEVIHGVNTLTKSKVEEAIVNYKEILEQQKEKVSEEEIAKLVQEYKENLDGEIYITEKHINSLTEMLEAINKA